MINDNNNFFPFCNLYLLGFIDKWISEPLRAIIISSKLFSVNKKKNLFLPPKLQQILVTLCAKFQVRDLVFLCCSYTRVVQYCRCYVGCKIVCLLDSYVFFDNTFITCHWRWLLLCSLLHVLLFVHYQASIHPSVLDIFLINSFR